MRIFIGIWLCLTGVSVYPSGAQDSIPKNTSMVFLSNPVSIKQDSTTFKIPKYKQGIICDFEDQLSRKKVPLNFQLGNSKY